MKKIVFSFILIKLAMFLHVPLRAQSTDEYRLNEKVMHPPPVVNFYITGLCYGDTTYFINKTDIGTIYWAITNDKGDTLFSAKTDNTKYFFKKKGLYNVCQTADNGHIATKIRTVLVDTITHAAFEFRKCINEFNNLSTCADQFVWTFPDNETSTHAFPTYVFQKAGTATVKLIAKKGNKANTHSETVTLPPDSLDVPKATFTFKRHGTSNVFDLVAVDSLADWYAWSFGDRQFLDTTGYKVTHTFDMSVYEAPVSLRVQNGCGFSTYELDPFAVTGINDPYFLNRNASVYPNPTSEEVNIAITNLQRTENILIRLIDVNGTVLQEHQSMSTGTALNFKFNTSSLSKGIYLIQLMMDGQLLNKKVIVQ